MIFFGNSISVICLLFFAWQPVLSSSKVEDGSTILANYNLPITRPYTLRTQSPFPLEWEYHRMLTDGKPSSFIFPRAVLSPVDSSSLPLKDSKLRLGENQGENLNFQPVLGLDYKYNTSHSQNTDFGLILFGNKQHLSFYLDARMFVELHEDGSINSYDREFIEVQDEEDSETLAYVSYSRYRANMSYDFSWGRWIVARDVLHWGPGQFYNLSFNQNAIPYNYLSFQSQLGPFSIISVYGQLSINQNKNFFRASGDSRNLFAHRYELNLKNNWTLGVSEQLIIYNDLEPFAFTPVVPLYILKGNSVERANNGNISFDISWSWKQKFRFYSEFLIDDIQSPTSLFNDDWGNKWAFLAGSHYAQNWNASEWGVFAEYARLEPWVYTHYKPNSAQAANFHVPLGNQLGPNSQSFGAKIYAHHQAGVYASVKGELIWKGTDLGSDLQDSIPNAKKNLPKEFILGVGSPEVVISPYFGINWKSLFFEAGCELREESKTAMLRVQILY